MPKQIHKIQEFHGGLNNSSDARDISDAELADIQDAVVSDLGKIRNMGGTTAHVASVGVGNNTRPYVTIKPGYGLFAFSHDRAGAELGSGTVANEEPTDYLVIADADLHANIWIYNFTTDTWMAPINMGSTSGMKPTFYIVDGVLRISDGQFGGGNANKWYGYIDRIIFKNIEPSYTINQWYLSYSKSESPRPSSFQNDVDFTQLYGNKNSIDGTSSLWNNIGLTRDALRLSGSGGTMANVSKAKLYFTYYVDTPGDVYVRVEIGTAEASSGTYGAGGSTFSFDPTNAEVFQRFGNVRIIDQYREKGKEEGTYEFFFDPTETTTEDGSGDSDHWGGSDGDTEYFGASIQGQNGVDWIKFTKMEVWANDTVPDVSTYVADNNVFLMTDWISDVGVGWCDGTTAGKFMFGVSFVYDEKQESQVTTLTQHDDVNLTTVTAAAVTATQSPGYRLHIGDFDNLPTWNRRVTSINLYLKDVTSSTTEPWYLQASFDLIKGEATLDSTQQKYNASYQVQSNENYYFWEIPNTDNVSPSKITTYEINSGFNEEEVSISSKFKTAVVTNRMAYIGNIEVQKEGQIGTTERKGDAMLKSPVNQFDNFPLSRIVEASIQDGDEIVKLEEYADRILQFKKKKMHLINVSQNLEFLEDTFMHKGIAHSSAAVKTDYGVAWVNENGAYLYDGQKVTDLLEKRGRQIIKESTWASFLGAAPVIGYLPNKRQLIILKSAGAEATNSAIYLFDMVTQSWTTGDSKFTDSARQTNFVVDANNNLVIGQQATPFEIADIVYWDDNADVSGTGTYKLHTKDIDFGQPGQRKKIYKAYISYKGDGDSVTVQYAINGDTDTVAPFYRTNADGSSDKTNSDTTPLLDSNTDDWILAELRPVTSINNVYSFQLRLGGTAESDFEINDISIVYRLKNIK